MAPASRDTHPFDACARDLRAAPRTWLVTGAAGFIGSHLIERLLDLDQTVVGFDSFATGKRENLAFVEQAVGPERWARFRMIEADVRDLDACHAAAAGVDYILHEAALGSVPRSIEEPLETHTANVNGTVNVFLAAIQHGVKRVVYASSSSVYGDDPVMPKVEDRLGAPLSPYAASKLIDEVYAGVFAKTHGLSAVGLRYFNVVGSRQDPEGAYAAVVPRWVATFARGERPQIFGDGETSRDFCPVEEVVAANIQAATTTTDLAGRVYNVALGDRTTLNELYAILRAGMAARGFPCADFEPDYQDFRPGDVRHSLADIAAARADLGYAPRTSLAAGLESVMDFFAHRL